MWSPEAKRIAGARVRPVQRGWAKKMINLRWNSTVHLDQMPAFDYDKLLWGERQIRSVANMTRQDARDFLQIAHDLNIRPQVTVFPLEDANQALLAVKQETADGSAVIVP